MNTARTCPQCHQPMPEDAPEGLCPQCLMQQLAAATNILPPGSTPARDTVDIADAAEVAKRLPQFEIIALLGRGGMGVVYKARQVQLERLVALKILPPEDSRSPDFVERFRREARSLAKLNHPNIVHVHDFGEGGGLYYIVMEFVEGANLRQMIQSKQLTPAEALAIVPKICDALQFAHEEGVMHRDIKPENILMDKKGRVKIADFGLAKLLHRDPAEALLTMSGMTLGTPRYMAPEQIDKPESVDHRADIYSLGVVFYEMLTGEVPMGRFAPPSQKVQVDVKLDEIVLHAMERDVERRYQHASEIKTDVEKVASNSGSAQQPARSQPPAGTMQSPLFWTVLFCVLGAASTVLTWTHFTKVSGQLPMSSFSNTLQGNANAFFTWHGVAVLSLFVALGLFSVVSNLDRRFPAWSAAIAIATAVATGIIESLQVFSINQALVDSMSPKYPGYSISVASQPSFGVFVAYAMSLGVLIVGFLQLRKLSAEPAHPPRAVQPERQSARASGTERTFERVATRSKAAAPTTTPPAAMPVPRAAEDEEAEDADAEEVHPIYQRLWTAVPLVAIILAFFNPWGGKGWYCFAAGCAILAVLPGLGIGWRKAQPQTSPEREREATIGTPAPARSTPAVSRRAKTIIGSVLLAAMFAGAGWIWSRKKETIFYTFGGETSFVKGANGPELARKFAASKGFTPEQVPELNKIFQSYYREFVSLERQHTEVTTDARGHVIVKISPFPDQSWALFTRLTKELRGVIGKDAIPAPERGFLYKIGLFRHAGEAEVTTELWKEGATYHYEEKHGMRPVPGGSTTLGGRGGDGKDWKRTFPEEYWVYWTKK